MVIMCVFGIEGMRAARGKEQYCRRHVPEEFNAAGLMVPDSSMTRSCGEGSAEEIGCDTASIPLASLDSANGALFPFAFLMRGRAGRTNGFPVLGVDDKPSRCGPAEQAVRCEGGQWDLASSYLGSYCSGMR